MNNKKSVNSKQIFKIVFSMLGVIGISLLFTFSLTGCSSDIKIKDAIQIAKEDFGCKKILWAAGSPAKRTLTSDVVYTEDGAMHLVERIFPDEGGYYVFGLDKNGNEVYVAVPRYKSSKYKPAKMNWPFDYTFSEILDFAGQYGYKYADGIDGREDEFIKDYSFGMNTSGNENSVKYLSNACQYCESLGSAFCDKLDIMVVFEFKKQTDDNRVYSYTIGQIGGKLMMMEIDFANDETTVYTYSR